MILRGGNLKILLNSPDLIVKAANFMILTRLLRQFEGVQVTI